MTPEQLKQAAAVMLAAAEGAEIQCRKKGSSTNTSWEAEVCDSPVFDWYEYDYRVKPKPRVWWIYVPPAATRCYAHTTKEDAIAGASNWKGQVGEVVRVVEQPEE